MIDRINEERLFLELWRMANSSLIVSPVGCSYRIHRLCLFRGVILPEVYPRYDFKPSNSNSVFPWAPLIYQSSSSLLLLPGKLWPRVVELYRVLSMCQKKCFPFKQCPNKRLKLNWIVWNRTVWPFNCV